MKLSCHCGNVALDVPSLPETLTSCNCSLCNRYGSLWGYYTSGEVRVRADKPQVPYRWGDGFLDFFHCPDCGCMTHSVMTEKSDEDRVGVNFRMAAPADIDGIRIRHFDGADSWRFLD